MKQLTTLRRTPEDPQPGTTTALSADGVTRVFGEGSAAVVALRGVSLQVPPGQFTAVMGSSGSGKSTLMHILAGFDRPTQGRVTIDGTDITRLDDRGLTLLRRQKVGFVFQFFNLLPILSAEQNVTLPLELAGAQPDPAWLDEILANVGLSSRRSHRPAELSGGEQQRVALARALVTRPAILFADEPTGNLDSRTGLAILDLLRDSVDSSGQTILMVTHDPRAAAMADRVLVLADGCLEKDLGPTSSERVIEALNELAERRDRHPAEQGVAAP